MVTLGNLITWAADLRSLSSHMLGLLETGSISKYVVELLHIVSELCPNTNQLQFITIAISSPADHCHSCKYFVSFGDF